MGVDGVDGLAKDLPPEERARYYRGLSADALRRAADAKDRTIRQTYVALALGWAHMAELHDGRTSPVLPEQAVAASEAGLCVMAAIKPPPPDPGPESQS